MSKGNYPNMAELFRSVKYDKIYPDVIHNFIEHVKTSAIRGKVVSAASAAAAATWDAAWRMGGGCSQLLWYNLAKNMGIIWG